MKRIKILITIIICLLIIVNSYADDPDNLIMIILIADDYENPDDNQIAEGVRADGRLMQQFANLLNENSVINVKPPVAISGRQVTKRNILNRIQNIRVGSNDVLMVFFSGHGGVEGREMRHHIYPCSGPVLYRDEMDRAILDKKARFSILITDACSSSVEGFKVPPPRYRSASRLAVDNLKKLFRYRGYLSVTAASEGEVAMGPSSGGFFTTSLVKNVLISNPPDNWEEVIKRSKSLVNELYDEIPGSMKAENKEMFGQISQNPKAYSMPSLEGSGETATETVTDYNDYSYEEDDSSTEGWDEGDEWWATEIGEEEGWEDYSEDDIEDWDYVDDETWGYLEDLSDAEWEELFDVFMEMLIEESVDIDELSEDELMELFYAFLEEYAAY